jgi:hypothetical protein
MRDCNADAHDVVLLHVLRVPSAEIFFWQQSKSEQKKIIKNSQNQQSKQNTNLPAAAAAAAATIHYITPLIIIGRSFRDNKQ